MCCILNILQFDFLKLSFKVYKRKKMNKEKLLQEVEELNIPCRNCMKAI